MQHVKKPLQLQVVGVDGGWGTRWWRDVDGIVENEKWTVGLGEDRKVEVYGDVMQGIN